MTAMVDGWTDEEFCREFWASLDEFYGRWKAASGGSLRDLEAAFERGKKNGIQPHPFFAKSKQIDEALESLACVIEDVAAERENQDAKWGGPKHDDQHVPADWLDFIEKQVGKAREQRFGSMRGRFIKIAALAVAAVESMNRGEKLRGPSTTTDRSSRSLRGAPTPWSSLSSLVMNNLEEHVWISTYALIRDKQRWSETDEMDIVNAIRLADRAVLDLRRLHFDEDLELELELLAEEDIGHE